MPETGYDPYEEMGRPSQKDWYQPKSDEHRMTPAAPSPHYGCGGATVLVNQDEYQMGRDSHQVSYEGQSSREDDSHVQGVYRKSEP